MVNRSKRGLGEILMDSGILTPAQLDKALEMQKSNGKKLGELLIDEGIISEQQLVEALEYQLKIPHIDFTAHSINPDVPRLISESLARRHLLIPVEKEGNQLTVAMADPLNIYAIDDVNIATGLSVKPALALRSHIDTALDKYYSNESAEKAVEDFAKEARFEQISEIEEEILNEVSNAPVVRLVDSIIQHAVRAQASDIHIEPYEKKIRIRFRIDGELQEIMSSSKTTHSAIVTRIKIISKMDIAEERIPQDGRVEMQIDDKQLDLSILNNRLRKTLGISEVDDNVLTSLGLFKNEKYNIAAKLFSDDNNIGKVTLLRYSDSVESIKDRIDLENMSILVQFDKCVDFYYKHVNKQEKIGGAYRKTIEEIPLVAYREAIANAICHRDYKKEANVKVEIFDDRIEITSPGGLPIGISYEDFIDGRISIPRNKIVAEIFYRLKLIEKIATGIRRIKSHYKDYDLKPKFEITANSVRVVLPNVLYKKGITLLEKEQKIVNMLNEKEFLSAKDISVTLGIKKTQTSKYLNDLISKGLVNRIGNGRNIKYMLKINE